MKKGFPGGGGGGFNMNMIKQAQKMQQDMMKLQEELENAGYSASAGGGAVEATVNGKYRLTAIKIAPEAVDPEDTEMLEDLIIAAVSEAINKAEAEAANEMKKLTGGLNIPGMF
ncbi:MAG: YbaB/EbfC family nucleoid-associated protein [Clostridiales bacterium]|jgi:DNA-binding YbaB/EbfC family protein|nr:YbaB/EbfC family nucleoid-associated protein [Clostridiales bacterium]